ncbi:hypothetical protein S83_026165, partial [Arachis hypogaea]
AWQAIRYLGIGKVAAYSSFDHNIFVEEAVMETLPAAPTLRKPSPPVPTKMLVAFNKLTALPSEGPFLSTGSKAEVALAIPKSLFRVQMLLCDWFRGINMGLPSNYLAGQSDSGARYYPRRGCNHRLRGIYSDEGHTEKPTDLDGGRSQEQI